MDCADSDCCQSPECQQIYEAEVDLDRLFKLYPMCAGVKEARQEVLLHEVRGPLASFFDRTRFLRTRDERDPRDKSVQFNFKEDLHAGYAYVFMFLFLFRQLFPY